jgi:hypothetical protein
MDADNAENDASEDFEAIALAPGLVAVARRRR